MKHLYNIRLQQKNGGQMAVDGRIGELYHPTNDNFPKITIQSPAEFKGPHDDQERSLHWTPEDLFVSSAAVCLFTTFISMAEKMHLEFKSITIDAEGTLEKDPEIGLMITKIHQVATITIANANMEGKATKAIEKAEKYCLIANSMKTKVTLEPKIIIES